MGNPGPCPPNPCRPGRLFCPNQTENYRTGTARVDINEAPGSLCPLCGQEERSLDINLSLVFTRKLSSSFPFSPRKPYFWAVRPIKTKSNEGRDCSLRLLLQLPLQLEEVSSQRMTMWRGGRKELMIWPKPSSKRWKVPAV